MKHSSKTLLISMALILMILMSACVTGNRTTTQQAPAATQAPQTQEAATEPTESEEVTEAAEVITIRLAHEDPPDNQWGMGANHFKELVEAKTNGAVIVQIYDNGQLGHGVDNIQQLQTNTLEMTIVGSDLADIDNFFRIFDLPYLFRDRDHAKKVLAGDLLVTGNEKLASHGLVLLAYWENGFRQITNSIKPIVVPEDLKGIKIRVPENPVRVATFAAYGANPLAMPFSELYTALQQGVVDAQENPYGNIWGDKLYEVQKYISKSNHVFTPISVLISKDYWDGLSPEIQTVLKEAAMETTIWQMDWAASQETAWLQDMVDAGCEFNDVDVEAFIAASQPIWDSVKTDIGEGADALIDAIVNTK